MGFLSRFEKTGTAPARLAAMEAVGACLMLTDASLNITYLNPAAAALLRAAEADLQKVLPHFSTDRLIGCNIDMFHKNPAHQRQMLARLTATHATTINVAGWVFDVRISPLSLPGKSIPSQTGVGFVIEWFDGRQRLARDDFSARMAAIDRVHSVVSFTPDGTVIDANDYFLRMMGYQRHEIIGQPHRMFVPSAEAASPAYRQFWEELRRGQFQARQFCRQTKDGKPVWIEGWYNPILDSAGRVAKVIKVATDITGQVDTLVNLKLLLDENFADVERGIAAAAAQTNGARLAVRDTSGNVQSVTASAAETVASISEIAHSMTRSRSATEGVFDRAVSVGESTGQLAKAAQAMGGIVGLIRNIASQINLLALNATIEAARAGQAGKGFAVVASEVKNLAIQAAKATEQISREIDGIQAISNEVASAVATIRDSITEVREYVVGTASAIEQQTAVTHSMSTNMQDASDAVATVSTNIAEIAAALAQVSAAVAKTKEGARILIRQ